MILGRQLAALREKAGLSYEQAAEVIYTSAATVRRMERAEGALKPLNVKSLLIAYGITDAREIDAFLALAATRPSPAGGTATTMCSRPGSAPSSAWRKRPR
jgi:transcriptional regulator with XRE-family HTH domain